MTSAVAVAGPTSIGMPTWLAVVLSAVLWTIVGTVAFQVAWYRPYIRFVRQHRNDRSRIGNTNDGPLIRSVIR